MTVRMFANKITVPLAFPNGSGRFAGEWVRFDARAVNEHETSVNWNLYGCHTGGTHSKLTSHHFIVNFFNQKQPTQYSKGTFGSTSMKS